MIGVANDRRNPFSAARHQKATSLDLLRRYDLPSLAQISKRGFALRLLGRLRSNPARRRQTPNWRGFGQWKRGDQLAAIGLAVGIAGVVAPIIAVPETPVIAVPEIRVSVGRDPSPSGGPDANSPRYAWP